MDSKEEPGNKSILSKGPGVENHLGSLQNSKHTSVEKGNEPRKAKEEVKSKTSGKMGFARHLPFLHSKDSGFQQVPGSHHNTGKESGMTVKWGRQGLKELSRSPWPPCGNKSMGTSGERWEVGG